MCELLGMSFDQPVDASYWLNLFWRRGVYNPDGWGLAWYPYRDGSIQIVKEPRRAGDSPLLASLLDKGTLQSETYLAHVRKKSSAGRAYRNTHPFYRRLSRKDYCFAHNGTLQNRRSWPVECFRPQGETDSEYAFCCILERLRRAKGTGLAPWQEGDFLWLQGELREINRAGRFNCVLSDGEHLFCYHDRRGHKGLRYMKGESGYIVATNPLTSEAWQQFQPGQLTVFKHGQLLFGG